MHGGPISIITILTCFIYTKVHYRSCAVRISSATTTRHPSSVETAPPPSPAPAPLSDHTCLQVLKLHHLFIPPLNQPRILRPSTPPIHLRCNLPVLKVIMPNIHLNLFQMNKTSKLLKLPTRPYLSICFARVLGELETLDLVRHGLEQRSVCIVNGDDANLRVQPDIWSLGIWDVFINDHVR